MIKLQILGSGCAKCQKLAAEAKAAVDAIGVPYTLEKITDIQEIMKFNVLMTPALAVNGVVKIAGRVPSAAEISTYLTTASETIEQRQSCTAAPTLIFACSGAADVGAIADQAARRMTREGKGKMYCLAGIGGRVSGILTGTRAASRILAIDGCPENCAKHCLEQAGLKNFAHVQLAEVGMEKGKSPLNDDRVAQAVAAGAEAMSAQTPPTKAAAGPTSTCCG